VLPYLTALGGTPEEESDNRARLETAAQVARLLVRGFRLDYQERYREALALAEESRRLDPANRSARRLASGCRALLAWKSMLANRLEEGLALCRQVIDDDPGFADVYLALAALQMRRGANDAAIAAAEELARRAPEHYDGRLMLAALYHKTGNTEKAFTTLAEIIKEVPGTPIRLSDVISRLGL
jgi:tetratricopeptide (TPR) repeat protein